MSMGLSKDDLERMDATDFIVKLVMENAIKDHRYNEAAKGKMLLFSSKISRIIDSDILDKLPGFRAKQIFQLFNDFEELLNDSMESEGKHD